MVWDWYGDRCIGKLLLHHDMAAALTHLGESMLLEDSAYRRARQDPKLTHA